MVDAKIPEGIPTGVSSAPSSAVEAPVAVVVTPPTSSEGPLDRTVKSIVTFLAKIFGKPDPITGELPSPSVASPAIQNKTNFVDKVRSTANSAVEKVATATAQTVNTVKSSVDTAVTEVKNVQEEITSPAATDTPSAQENTQSLDGLGTPH